MGGVESGDFFRRHFMKLLRSGWLSVTPDSPGVFPACLSRFLDLVADVVTSDSCAWCLSSAGDFVLVAGDFGFLKPSQRRLVSAFLLDSTVST